MPEDIIDFENAGRIICDAVPLMPVETMAPADAVGRVLSEDMFAPEDLPRFASSAMDGWVVPAGVLKALEDKPRVTAVVRGEIAAGSDGAGRAVGPMECMRIFTGAPVPEWAEAVVKQEDCVAAGQSVAIRGPVSVGQHIRPAGGDVKAGSLVMTKGARITPPAVGLLAALGVASVPVRRRPILGLIVTGAEISDERRLAPGRIRDANGPALETLAYACGADLVHRVRVGDSPAETADALSRYLGEVEVLCVSGGVSVGDHDCVRSVLSDLGTEQVIWGVAQRPGKPFYFGLFHGRPVFGLPGNPASSLACFLAHVWAAMRWMQGAVPRRIRRMAVLRSPVIKQKGFTAMVRGRRLFDGATTAVEPTGQQESNLLLPFARADCLILCPPRYDTVPAGTLVEVIPFPWGE